MKEPTKSEMDKILSKTEISNKLLNAFKEYLRFQESMLNSGYQFEKKVTKFSKTSAAIYLPKRLIGKTFKVFLIPIDDAYEISEPVSEKQADKLIKEAEKDVEKIQTDRKKLIEPII
jgi:putative transposon-encoded protein